ncbi:MAG: hypothetical protein K2Y30_02085 [Flavobacteriaceae bacterium]|nr:hypothetical protein [Flavobacteriaceae bacterium]
MRKLIHSKFELDLSPFKISDTEDNNWFSDSFFTKYSFPFDIDLTEDLDQAFGFISFYNSSPETYFELLYVHNNKIEKAIFEVEAYQDKLTTTVRFGFEQLPSFDKLLSELSLEKFDLPVGTTIYEHAETIITKTWPDVNYNFPQIHVDKYDPTDTLWNGFQSTVNNRVDGIFLTNTVDTIEDITYNRNVIQPLPYWIYILERIMIDSGYTLAGKIIDDPRLQRACLFADVDYFTKPTFQEQVNFFINLDDYIEINYNNKRRVKAVKYFAKTVLVSPGKYNISGTIKVRTFPKVYSYFYIRYRGNIIYKYEVTGELRDRIRTLEIDLDFETIDSINPNDVIIDSDQIYNYDEIVIADLSITCLRLNDASGVAIPTILNENKINLTKAVPNIKVADFVKVVKNWFNYDLSIVGKTAIMNPVEIEINYKDAIDMQHTEVKKPYIKYSQGISFLLKFTDTDNTDYKFLPVFHSKDSVSNSNFITNDKTNTIEIEALPLPLLTRNGVQTAFALEENDAKVYLVPYNGMLNGNNISRPIDDYLIPSVHLQYWSKWFDFRIKSQGFLWLFKSWNEKIMDLKAKTKIFAYKRFHIIKTINKTEVRPDLFEVEIETETLP